MGLTFRLGQIPLAILTDTSNNVGIGAAPSGTYKLEVTGTAKVSSTLLVSGAATFSSSETNPLTLYSTTTSGEGHKIQWQGNYLSNLIVADIRGNGSGAGGAFIIRTADTSSVLQTRLTITNVGKVTIPSGAYGLSYFSMNYTNANAGSREWAIGSDTAGWGSFSIGQATTQGGSTFSDKIIISSAGNVGIGINSTSAKLYVLGSNEVFNVAGTNAVSTYTGYYYNTSTLVGYIGNGSSILSGAASDSFIFRSEGALVYAIGNSEKMRITSGGDVCFGKTVYDNSTTGVSIADTKTTAIVSVVTDSGVSILCNRKTTTGQMFVFRYNGSNVGDISTNGSTITFSGNAVSDNRYKDNIEKITNAVDAINKVDWVTFKYKDNQRDSAGVTAQQLQTVPELLKFVIDGIDEDSYKAVDYNAIIGYLGAAIKEQNQLITSLQDRLDKAGL